MLRTFLKQLVELPCELLVLFLLILLLPWVSGHEAGDDALRSSLILWSAGLAWRAILLQFLVAVFAKDWLAFRGTLTAWKAAVANVLSLFIGFVAFEVLVAGDDRFFVGGKIGIALLLSCSVFTAPFMIASIPEAWFDRLLPRSARAVPR